jgi:phenylacetate-CoA ligase
MELVPARDGEWEIVGTALHNLGMPFLRYRTGDLAAAGRGECPCGRRHPLISHIKGREGDIIVTPEGNIVAPVAMDYAFYHLDEIKEGQVIQEDITTLRVKIVAWEKISPGTTERLLKELRSYLKSPTMTLILDEVDEIPRTGRGKKPFIISRIRVEDYI